MGVISVVGHCESIKGVGGTQALLDWRKELVDVNFKGTLDHAKFALGADEAETDNLLCIGDLNRMCSQEKRGGGAICRHDNAGLYKAFVSSIASIETCWEYNPCPTSSVDYGSGSQCYWC